MTPQLREKFIALGYGLKESDPDFLVVNTAGIRISAREMIGLGKDVEKSAGPRKPSCFNCTNCTEVIGTIPECGLGKDRHEGMKGFCDDWERATTQVQCMQSQNIRDNK